MYRPSPKKPPVSQEQVNRGYAKYLRDNRNGDDVLAGLNMFWKYFSDNPKEWHPAFCWGYSLKHAACIMGLNWKGGSRGNWQYFKPRTHYIAQMRDYGVEEDRETGWLKVTNLFRWKHALSLARQTGRCPPSTFALRISDPTCDPDDPVDPNDLPPKHVGGFKKGPRLMPGLLTTGARPDCIEKEMIRIGHGDRTYDARRVEWFNGRQQARVRAGGRFSPSVREDQNPTFAQMARAQVERLARA